MTPFTERAIAIIKSIPPGKVMTYGQIGHLAGSPRGARQVARILHSMSKKHSLPWHRVLNSKGEISLSEDEFFNTQKLYLEMEGVEFVQGNRLDLERYQFHPDVPSRTFPSD